MEIIIIILVLLFGLLVIVGSGINITVGDIIIGSRNNKKK